jgi:hypothetical protein
MEQSTAPASCLNQLIIAQFAIQTFAIQQSQSKRVFY